MYKQAMKLTVENEKTQAGCY